MKEIFQHVQQTVAKKWPKEHQVKFTAISGFFFLRFICPAILGPRQFNLMPEHPKELPARNLTLIAKTLMNLGNLVEFGQKEPYMEVMNTYISQNTNDMRTFLQQISSPKQEQPLGELPVIEEDSSMARVHHFLRLRFDDIQRSNPTHPSVQTLADQLSNVETFTTRVEARFKRKTGAVLLANKQTDENLARSDRDRRLSL